MEIGKATKLNEKKRTYFYPVVVDDSSPEEGKFILVPIVIENVIELIVRESGTHRLKTVVDGQTKLQIMPAGWLRIEIEDKDWTI